MLTTCYDVEFDGLLLRELGKAGKSDLRQNIYCWCLCCSSTSRPSWIRLHYSPFYELGKAGKSCNAHTCFSTSRPSWTLLLQLPSWSRKEQSCVRFSTSRPSWMGFFHICFGSWGWTRKSLLSSMPQWVGRPAYPGPSYGCTLSVRATLTRNGYGLVILNVFRLSWPDYMSTILVFTEEKDVDYLLMAKPFCI